MKSHFTKNKRTLYYPKLLNYHRKGLFSHMQCSGLEKVFPFRTSLWDNVQTCQQIFLSICWQLCEWAFVCAGESPFSWPVCCFPLSPWYFLIYFFNLLYLYLFIFKFAGSPSFPSIMYILQPPTIYVFLRSSRLYIMAGSLKSSLQCVQLLFCSFRH